MRAHQRPLVRELREQAEKQQQEPEQQEASSFQELQRDEKGRFVSNKR